MKIDSLTPRFTAEQKDRRVVWLSAAAAAARVGVSVRTVKRWTSAQILPASRLPSPKGMGRLRIRLNDLEALIASGALA